MTIFSLVGEILLKDNNTKGKLQEIESAGSKTGSTLDGAFSKIGGALLKLGAVVGVAMGFKQLFSVASAYQQTLAQTDAVLKSTSGAAGMTKQQLIALADAQSKVTTFSKGTNMATENLLLTFTNIGQKVFPDALKSVNDMSQALGQDTKSSAIQLGKALNDPIKGVTALQRVGVTFTAAQKEQIKSMVEAGNVAGAQKVILQELQKEFGGSAEAAGKTFGGQLTILRNQLTGVGVGIVSKLLPPLTTLVTAINNHMPQIQAITTNVINGIGNAVNSAMPIIEKIIEDGIKIAGNIFPNIGGSAGGLGSAIAGLVGGGLTVLKDVMDWLAQHGSVVQAAFIGITTALLGYKAVVLASNSVQEVQSVLFALQAIKAGFASDALAAMSVSTDSNTAAQWLLNAALNANPIGLVVGAIAIFIGVLVLAYQHSETFRNIVNGAFNGIKSVAVSVFNFLKGFIGKWGVEILAVIAPFIGIPVLIYQHWSGITAFVSNLWNSVKTTTSNVWNSIVSAISGFVNGVKNTISTVFNAVATFLTTIWNTISNVFNTVINAIVSTAMNIFNTFKSSVLEIFDGIKTYFTGVWELIKTIFLGALLIIIDLVTGNFTKLSQDAQLIWNDLKTAFSNIWNGIKEIFSGALDFLKAYVTTVWNTIKSTTESLWNGLKSFLSSLWDSIKSLASSAWNGLKDAVVSIVTSVVDTAKSIWNGLLSWFESLPGRLYNAGSSMFNSLKSGISSVIGTITSVVKNGFNGAINFITSLPGKAVTWGRDFINGLTSGIRSVIGAVGNAVEGVANKIRSVLHFSVPDEGPLTDYESWMPDFMTGLASGIESNKFKVTDKIKELAGDMKIDAAANISTKASNTSKSNNNNISNSKDNTPKQPIILQLILQNGKVLAEYLIDDINKLQGTMQLSSSRLNLGRR